MGMFDYIKCEYPLPDKEVQNHDFQTKDFDNAMDCYTITADGKLILHKHIWKAVPEEERPYYGEPEWEEGGFYQVAGSIKSVHVGDEVVDFHGIIRFYAMRGDERYEYKAKFTDGILVELKRNLDKK